MAAHVHARKPQMMKATCADGTVVTWPEAIQKPLKDGKIYYSADNEYCSLVTWDSSIMDYVWLNRGISHLSKEAAQQHWEALQSINHGSANWRDKL